MENRLRDRSLSPTGSHQLISSLFETDDSELLKFFESIREQVLWRDEIHCQQSGLQVDPSSVTPGFLDACNGKLDESTLNTLHPFYKNTIVEELISVSGVRISRLRWMIMKPRSCYSIHSDPSPRLHVPISTRKDCYLVFPEQSIICHLEPGFAYKVDTTKKHTAINATNHERVHLIGCIY